MNKGITEFVRKKGNVSATVAREEILRVIKEAKKEGLTFSEKAVTFAFYRLRRIAGIKRAGNKKIRPKEKQMDPAVRIKEALLTVNKATEEMKENLEETLKLLQRSQEEKELLQLQLEEACEENTSLQCKNKELQEQLVLLEQLAIEEVQKLALSLPKHPGILQAVQEAKSKEPDTKLTWGLELPQSAATGLAQPVYHDHFMKKFNSLNEGEKRQVVKAVHEVLDCSLGGPLKSGKVVSHLFGALKKNDWKSRASRKIRFFWRRDKVEDSSTVIFLEIALRGDTGFSEAY